MTISPNVAPAHDETLHGMSATVVQSAVSPFDDSLPVWGAGMCKPKEVCGYLTGVLEALRGGQR